MTPTFDKTILDKAVIDLVEHFLFQVPGASTSQSPETRTVDIDDYDYRMKVTGIGRFESPSFISVVHLFSPNADTTKEKNAKGVMVVLISAEVAGKLLKGIGFNVPEDEDDGVMMEFCGQLTTRMVQELLKKLAVQGYMLKEGAVEQFRNNVLGGVAYHNEQRTKQEYTFFLGRSKAMIVEVVLTALTKGAS